MMFIILSLKKTKLVSFSFIKNVISLKIDPSESQTNRQDQVQNNSEISRTDFDMINHQTNIFRRNIQSESKDIIYMHFNNILGLESSRQSNQNDNLNQSDRVLDEEE